MGIFALLFATVAVHAQLIIQPTVNAYSSQNPYGIDRRAAYTRDGSGLAAGPSALLGAADSTHGSTATPGMWTTRGNTGVPNDLDPYITYDLGAAYTLQTTRIWNYNETGFLHPGARDVLLSTSSDGTNFSTLTTLNLMQGVGGPAEMAQDFATRVAGVRYVRLQILTNWDGSVFWSSITGTNYAGPDGRYLAGLSEVRFVVATVTPIVSQQPASQTLPAGSSASFMVTATDVGFPPLGYRWRKNGETLADTGNISGSRSSNLVVSAIAFGDGGRYDVVITNSMASVTSSVARLVIGGTLITPNISAFSSEYNSGGIQRLAANLVNGLGMSGAGSYTDTHGNAEEQVWHHGPGDANPWVTFDLDGYYNLLVARYWNLNQQSGTANGAKNVRVSVSPDNATYTVIGTNLVARALGTAAEPAQDFQMLASSIRYVKIEPLDGYGGGWNGLSSVRFEGSAVTTPVPNITTQPVGVTNLAGGTVVLNVVADPNGLPPLTYRWRKNGVNLVNGGNVSGAGTDTLTLSSITGADTANYTVVVSNTVAGLSSANAPVVVVLPPVLSLSARSGGRLVTPTMSTFSTEFGGSRQANNLTNSNHLTGPGYYSDTKDNVDYGWGPELTDTAPSVVLDLGGTFDLQITRIWNFNSPGYAGAGAKDIRISVSMDTTNFSALATNTLVIAGNTANEPAQDFATVAAGIRYVRLEPLNGYGGAERAIGAVRFVVADPQRPILLSAVIQGITGLHHTLEINSDLSGTNWQTVDIPSLPASPYRIPLLDGLIPTNAPANFVRSSLVWP